MDSVGGGTGATAAGFCTFFCASKCSPKVLWRLRRGSGEDSESGGVLRTTSYKSSIETSMCMAFRGLLRSKRPRKASKPL